MERGHVLRVPTTDVLQRTRVGEFLGWLRTHRDLDFHTHEELHAWSVRDLEGFWSAVWQFFEVISHAPYECVLREAVMPGARWFEGAQLNYAEHALRASQDPNRLAVLGRSQTRGDVDLTFSELADQVARARAALLRLGVAKGDRVAAYVPNIPEALVAFLATASLGAVWASCASEFGSRSVVDRFAQIEPTVLLVAGGYRYGVKDIDRAAEVADVRAALPSVEHVIDLEYDAWRVHDALSWTHLLDREAAADLTFEPVPFEHPLFVLFSSGTTGPPKAIVHGHGGIVLEHLKNHALSWDMGPADRMLWFTTTAWMMWNTLVSSLLIGSSLVMVDGDPTHPDLGWQWRLAEESGATIMGASPGYIMACRKGGLDLAAYDLSVRMVGSAGAPLPPEGYRWVLEQLGDQVMLNVGSGGTDVCSAIVQNNPLLPVYAGEISGSCLGVAAQAYDERGQRLVGELGELVITAPMPSMPLGFWGDEDSSRYRATYFETYPGVWRHGDWIVFNDNGSCHVAGRSDATLNRGGVRLGTAEFYRVVEELEQVRDSLVVHLEDSAGGNGELILFVATAPAVVLDQGLRSRIGAALRSALSPRHVPDTVVQVPGIPRNLTGKKLELPVKRILRGIAADQVVSRDALSDPASLDAYIQLAAERAGSVPEEGPTPG